MPRTPFAQQFSTGDKAIDTALGVGVPAAANLVAPGAGSVIANLLKHPLWGSLMGNIGSKLLRGILGPELPYGEYAQEQLSAISGILPELQAGAAGQPTAASRAIREQVKTEGQRMQQSYATGARRAGMVGGLPGGTAPYRAQQGRAQAATQAAMTQRLGQYQTGSQQILAGMAPTAFQHAGIQEMTDMQKAEEWMGSLGRFSRQYAQNQYDPLYQEMLAFLKDYFFTTTKGR